MSMVLVLRTLSDSNIEKVLVDPPLIWKIVAPDDPEAYETARSERPGLLSRLFGRRSPLTLAPNDVGFNIDEGGDVDLDKAWHAIHYMLTQSAWDGNEPLNFLVGGGAPVGDIDVG